MEGGSRDQLQPRAGAGPGDGAVDHAGFAGEYWRELIQEERNLGEMSGGYGLCLLRLRDTAAELAVHRREGLHLRVNLSNLSILRRRLLVEHGMLAPAVDPLPVRNTEEVLREEEERILLAFNHLCIDLHHQETTTAEHLNVHRLAIQNLSMRVHSFDADEERQAVDEMLREAKMLLRQIDASYKEYSLRLRQAIAEIDGCRVEHKKIREMNASLSFSIHSLRYGERTAAPTQEWRLQEGGVESQVRPHNDTALLCNIWKRSGACTYGDRCRFAHGQQELQRHPLYKIKPCLYFLSASGCKYGHTCSYRHGPHGCPPPE